MSISRIVLCAAIAANVHPKKLRSSSTAPKAVVARTVAASIYLECGYSEADTARSVGVARTTIYNLAKAIPGRYEREEVRACLRGTHALYCSHLSTSDLRARANELEM